MTGAEVDWSEVDAEIEQACRIRLKASTITAYEKAAERYDATLAKLERDQDEPLPSDPHDRFAVWVTWAGSGTPVSVSHVGQVKAALIHRDLCADPQRPSPHASERVEELVRGYAATHARPPKQATPMSLDDARDLVGVCPSPTGPRLPALIARYLHACGWSKARAHAWTQDPRVEAGAAGELVALSAGHEQVLPCVNHHLDWLCCPACLVRGLCGMPSPADPGCEVDLADGPSRALAVDALDRRVLAWLRLRVYLQVTGHRAFRNIEAHSLGVDHLRRTATGWDLVVVRAKKRGRTSPRNESVLVNPDGPDYCAVHALDQWRAARELLGTWRAGTAVFTIARPGRTNQPAEASTLKVAHRRAQGGTGAVFSTHSGRTGFAQDAFRAGHHANEVAYNLGVTRPETARHYGRETTARPIGGVLLGPEDDQ